MRICRFNEGQIFGFFLSMQEFRFKVASGLGSKVESPAFAILFQILRKPRFRIHYKEQTAMKKCTKYKIYKTAFQTMGLLMIGQLCNSCTSLHGVKLSIDTSIRDGLVRAAVRHR